MIDLQIRPAAAEDAEAVLAFWKESAEGTSVSDDVDGVTRLVERDPEALLLAVADGRIVGSVIAGWDGWRASLYRLAVLPPYRRRGISTALLRAADERFLALGGRRVDAMVLEANGTGQRLWTAAGYERQDHWRRWVRPLTR
ncbi:GNAT family N-acetyltransferase [Streptomyces sp. NBC_00691]|uniref:GNAT family N-acetyltransferase n=1 Tax=Streptomyces sp. NBC_00691 TaxID=2903671 RepID=UPI002E3241EE|nr:GNAT family N-acetyltransferase [Streptomyces sp. NBC_00691]